MINEVSTRLTALRRGHTNRQGFTLVELLVVIGVILLLIAMLLPAARKSVEAGRQVTCLSHLRQIAQATLLYCQDNDDGFPGVAGVDPWSSSYPAPLPSEWIYSESLYSAPFNDVTRSPILRYLAQRDPAVLRCPSDDITSHPNPNLHHPEFGPYNFSYVMNGWIGQWPRDWSVTAWKTGYGIWPAAHLREIKNPSQKILFLEEDPRFIDDGTYFVKIFLSSNAWAEPPSYVHDIYRDMADPTAPSAGQASRTNVVFCDGHGEFVTGQFVVDMLHPQDRSHYDPHW